MRRFLVALFLFPLAACASVTSQIDKSGPFLITGLPQVISTGFPFQQSSDLVVLDEGNTSFPRDPAAVLVLGSDYTVSGGGYNPQNQMQVGSINVSSGGSSSVAVGDKIVIMRGVPINQITSFISTGPLTIQLLEQALDKEATLAQQIGEVASRSLQFENFEFLSPTLMLSARKGMLLGFDANGNVFFYPLSSGGGGGGGGGSSNVAATSMVNLRLISTAGFVNGTVVQLAGFYNPGDGGGGSFVWESTDTAADNGGTVIAVAGVTTGRLHRIRPSSNYGGQLPNTTVDVRWFGAVPDNSTDCTPGFLAAYESCLFSGSLQNAALYAPAGNYAFKTPLQLYSGLAGGSAETGAINICGDGPYATQFYFSFPSSASYMFDFGSTPFVSLRNFGIYYGSPSVNVPVYLNLHTIAELDVEGVRGGGLTGTFMEISGISAWTKIDGLQTANAGGVQLLVNGSGGIITNFNLANGAGNTAPCVWVKNCNALHISGGQIAGSGPWQSYTGASLASGASTFTITEAGHGFVAGDYIYIASAATHSGYVSRWKIASVTTNTITVSSAANLGSDTVTFGSLWSGMYWGGGFDTESSCRDVLINTSGATPSGSSGLFCDGYYGSVIGIKFSGIVSDYGNTGAFFHGLAQSSYDGSNSFLYTVITSTASTFTMVTATGQTAAASMVNGHVYVIQVSGTTDWTSLGASSTAIGTIFTYNGTSPTGSGGIAANVVNHTLFPGGYARLTGGPYEGWWKISSVTSNTITVQSTINAGTAVTQPLEGDILSSTVGGIIMDSLTTYTGDTFGGIRCEGADTVQISNPQVYTPGGGSHFQTGPFTSLVISDGGQAIPSVDVTCVGGVLTNVGQSAAIPNGTIRYGVNIDGPLMYGAKITGSLLDGGVTPFYFTNSATPNSCSLDTDYFMGLSSIVKLGSGGQSFTTSVQAALSYAYAKWDPEAMWNPSAPTVLTPPIGAQLVRLTGGLHWTSNPTPAYVVIHQFNSSNSVVDFDEFALASQPFNAQLTVTSHVYNIQPGDYFDFEALQDSGSTQTLANSLANGLTLEVIK